MPSEKTKEHVFDISQNLTIEQILVRTYRLLPSGQQARYAALSRRRGIPVIYLLRETIDSKLANSTRTWSPRPIA